MSHTKKIAGATVLTAIATAFSYAFFPVGPTKVYPFQHMVNAIAGILLGPVYAIAVATAAGILRNILGTGTIFAFPGGIPGALVVGVVYRYLWKKDYAALTEPIGTAIGAIISGLIVAPMIGREMSTLAFLIAFLASSIPGAILGFIVVRGLRKSGFTGFE
ncbi:MAG: energy coupling factor transporter S component ThiW [Methanocellales archaeon]